MTAVEQRIAAKEFAADWAGRGDEKQETQTFWLSLLRKVYGVSDPGKFIEFEVRVKLEHTSFIDGLIKDTRVLIEQKGQDIDLRKGYKQSDGSMLTPFQQARRYAGFLPHDQNPRWIVVCNFQEFHIHDMNRPNDAPEVVMLSDLEKEYSRLNFLVDTGDENIKREMEISMQAGELVGKLYDAFLKQYKDATNERTLKSLNALCVRLVFCLYAEDAGIFGKPNMFHDYMRDAGVQRARQALVKLFRVLDQKPDERDPYLADDDPLLALFPYVNGGLFSDENIEIPPFNDEIFELLLTRASEDFNWSDISPTIFGAVFESTLNPETRRKGGMHYTSIENIHKVIDPLFLDDLRSELDDIRQLTTIKTRERRLEAFQDKIASLKFLDPACGSGNFLTETYLSLRKLENEVLSLLLGGQIALGFGELNPIKVSIGQFYGIEINDFAATVAKTALWIAESQMMKLTEDIVHMNLDFLPLKSYVNIVEGNALCVDWESVVPKAELSYIMGNPPFVGQTYRSAEQADDIKRVFHKNPKAGKLDYVAGWYKVASDYIIGTRIQAAFVSTNSIVQGEQVAILWKDLFAQGIEIHFAYRTFAWTSEAHDKAAVHCVIIGFSATKQEHKVLYDEGVATEVPHINGYLINGDDVFIQARGNPLTSGMPKMTQGSKPVDGGNLILSEDERTDILGRWPELEGCIKPFMGSSDFINGKKRFCIWLHHVSPSTYRKNPEIITRLEKVVEMRKASPTKGFQAAAETPMLFAEIRQPNAEYLAIPEVSTQRRRYIPIGYMSPSIIASNKLYVLPDVTLYMFGVLTSNVHMAWMRTVCGRLKSDYSYSPVVYNNFPWPTPTDAQKAKIEQTAQAILDARTLYPDCSLADLYDEVTMPPELRKAHQQNDKAVMEAYGMSVRETTEASCVAELMRRYQALTSEGR